ncbi:hypothetical protein ASPVEDRAFT_425290 [Aspergillus versicolor CBS 583.65]|uniref:Uncharacterized protein n=1 Tax=Aspergillus versicolor CBS 583.65 TaxID=1036611 RepID=A0A1L9P8B8_ASPVE|nr:uncharacterized protein ASPVEDRAFT_425290 [Aspergillus versicolor CBS 583.65]OJI97736.1 hypothetical protein ASPVEDRAFT_425290 [Aspergillus versicolor CBS 583.65]
MKPDGQFPQSFAVESCYKLSGAIMVGTFPMRKVRNSTRPRTNLAFSPVRSPVDCETKSRYQAEPSVSCWGSHSLLPQETGREGKEIMVPTQPVHANSQGRLRSGSSSCSQRAHRQRISSRRGFGFSPPPAVSHSFARPLFTVQCTLPVELLARCSVHSLHCPNHSRPSSASSTAQSSPNPSSDGPRPRSFAHCLV